MSRHPCKRPLAHRLLLLAYPRRFRRRHGEHLLDLYADTRDSARPGGDFRHWRRIAGDALMQGTAARWEERRRGRRPANPAPTRTGSSPRSGKGGFLMTLAHIAGDVRLGVRNLRRAPGFSTVALLTLAVAIGANTAIFSLVNAVVLRPLPFAEPGQLVRIYGSDLVDGDRYGQVSLPNIIDVRDQATSFAAISMIETRQPIWLNDAGAKRLAMRYVHAAYFEALGVTPLLGRLFTVADEGPDNSTSIAITHDLWVREFGADPAAVGRSIDLSGQSFEIIGVLPAFYGEVRFAFEGSEVDVYRPWPVRTEDGYRSGRSMAAMGRIRSGVTLEAAQAEIDAIYAGLTELYPEENTGNGLALVPLRDSLVTTIKPALLVLWAAVGLVLMIGCVNLANLMLARANGRAREVALRAALGARRATIVRQILVESLLLGITGGALGIVVARLGTDLLLRLGTDVVPRVSAIPIDWTVLAFASAISVLTGLVFGVAPALRAARADVGDALRAAGRTATAGTGGRRALNALVVAEVALAVVLLTGAGLFARSFANLLAVDPGVHADGVLTARVFPVWRNYADAEGELPAGAIEALYERVFDRLEAIPGVTSTGAVTYLPMGGSWSCDGFRALDRPEPAPGEYDCAETRTVLGNYFEAMGVTLISGRFIDSRDRGDTQPVAVINEALATLYWPGENPVGKSISSAHGEEIERQVVGVIGNIRQFGPGRAAPLELYIPRGQDPWTPVSFTVVVNVDNFHDELAAHLRAAVQSVDADLAIDEIASMETVAAGSIAPERFRTLLLGMFAATAMLLAVIGMYGVMSTVVGRRTREMGVRTALGAAPTDLFHLVVREGVGLAAVGLIVGVIGAIASTRVISGFLFGVTATDPATLGGVAALVVGVAFLACWIPARRATRVDPVTALRSG